ncbi:MAG: metallophosphatase/phosphoesterase [Edafosvirus sp.]|uniref:Metallophosphatase/phosphoesterase n=1 Tax=Edafosvirus sp. TaxID=2487765 RepID=A0A3G4ZY04_9VIRU|nr:MAG: metallophosphatase/phosphoesterase [Edafosvirus sp.]
MSKLNESMGVPKYILIGGSPDKIEFLEDCPGYNYLPTILPATRRIVVMGDIHGDYNLLIKLLKMANVIDDDLNWIGEDTHIVQVGDQVDRCRPFNVPCDHELATYNDEASDIKILKLFTELNIKAMVSGGAVISLLGNHEIMNVMGQMNYVSRLGLKEFENYKDPNNPSLTFKSGLMARKHAFKPGNEYSKFLACTRISAVIIGSNIFVHGGILPQFLKDLDITKNSDLEKINITMRRWLLGKINKKYVDKILNSTDISMFWTRILGAIPHNIGNNDPKCEKYLEPVLKILQVGHMIIGHTPQFFANTLGINSTCGKELWRVDSGSSMAFNHFDKQFESKGIITDARKAQVLEILNDSEFRIIA